MVATRLFHVRGLGHDSGISGTLAWDERGPFAGVIGFSQGAAVAFLLALLAETADRDAIARGVATDEPEPREPGEPVPRSLGASRVSDSDVFEDRFRKFASLDFFILCSGYASFARAEPPRDPALRRRAHRREHVAPGVPGARGREGRGGSRSGIPPRRRVVPKRRDARKARREARSVRALRRRPRRSRSWHATFALRPPTTASAVTTTTTTTTTRTCTRKRCGRSSRRCARSSTKTCGTLTLT